MQHQPALEAQEQVLAMGVDAAHDLSRQALRPTVERVPALRREDLVGDPTFEHGANPRRGVRDRVSLRLRR